MLPTDLRRSTSGTCFPAGGTAERIARKAENAGQFSAAVGAIGAEPNGAFGC